MDQPSPFPGTVLPCINQEIIGFERDQKARQGLQRLKSGREDKKWSLAGCGVSHAWKGVWMREAEDFCGQVEAVVPSAHTIESGKVCLTPFFTPVLRSSLRCTCSEQLQPYLRCFHVELVPCCDFSALSQHVAQYSKGKSIGYFTA